MTANVKLFIDIHILSYTHLGEIPLQINHIHAIDCITAIYSPLCRYDRSCAPQSTGTSFNLIVARNSSKNWAQRV